MADLTRVNLGRSSLSDRPRPSRFPTFARTASVNILNQVWINGFSPDNRYFSYTTQSDRYEIRVATYPDAAERQTVSDSGIETVWCPCGELFYRDGNRWYSTRVTTEPELDFDPPTLAFQTDFIDTPGISYAVTPDGQRLLVVKRDAQDDFTQLRVVTNWQQVYGR